MCSILKKILIDARSMASTPSGIGMYLYNFLKEIINYKNFEITLITDVIESEEIKYFQKLNIDIISYGSKVSNNFKVFSYFKFIKKELTKLNPDVFWEPNFIIPINLKFKGKKIITIHDIFPITHPECYNWKYRIYFKFFLSKTIKNIDYIMYDSKTTKDGVENWNPRVKNIKSDITYIAIDFFDNKIKTIDKNYFIYIGNIEKRKGFDLLLEAYNLYNQHGGKNKLYIVGKLKEKKLKEKISKLEGIKYFGYVDKKEKNKLLNECSCFIFPSRAEGFGMPIIEAMHYNKPIIASDLKIFKELIGNCINYFELTNDFNETFNNLFLSMLNYDKCDQNRYKKVTEKYSSNKLIRKIIKILEM